ncbi:MAG: thymidine kinase [Arcanobacterium sp.]|nr:thymidine kinase [Arcanobacterium sp.]
MAKLFFDYGAMDSGKTTYIIQTHYNYRQKGMNPAIVKPATDLKAGNRIRSRIGLEAEVDFLVTPDDDVYQLLREVETRFNVVLVDEAQFLTRAQVDQLFELVTLDSIPVMCFGLRTDFTGNPFPGSQRLLELAHEIRERKTICRCGAKATMNARKVNGVFITEGDQVAIDGIDAEYESLCGKCFMKYVGSIAALAR